MDVSEEHIASIIRVKTMSKMVTTLAVTSNLSTQRARTANAVPTSLIVFTLMMEAIISSETSILTRATRRHIQEDSIILIYLLILKSFIKMHFMNALFSAE
jgi:hypothetical protein